MEIASGGGKMRDPGNEVANCPRAVHQYSDMPPRLLEQAPIFDVASLYPSLFWELRDERNLPKHYNFDPKASETC